MTISFQKPFPRDEFSQFNPQVVGEFEQAHSCVWRYSPYSKTVAQCYAELHQCFSSKTRQVFEHDVSHFEAQAWSYLCEVESVEVQVYVVAISTIFNTRPPRAQLPAQQKSLVLSPVRCELSFRRLCACNFQKSCTQEDVETEVAQRFEFFDDFCSEYRRLADSAKTPIETVDQDLQYLKERFYEELDAKKAQAIGILRRFEEQLCSLFPSVEEDDFFGLCVEDRQRFLWVYPQLQSVFQSSDHRLLSSECWESLVYMLSVMPPNVRFMQTSLEWLKGQTDFPNLPALIRAIGYASHIPLCTEQQLGNFLRGGLPVRYWFVGPLREDEFLQILERVVNFRKNIESQLCTTVLRWRHLLPRGLGHYLFAQRSPLYIEWLVLSIRGVLLHMPVRTQKLLQSLDAEAVIAVLASRKDILWNARNEESIAELLVIFAHILHLGVGGRRTSSMILQALQKVRENTLLISDPFLLEHPLSDPCLAILNVTESQLQDLREAIAGRKDRKTAGSPV